MKKVFLLIIVLVAFLSTNVVNAQFNPYAENVKLLTVGVGISGYGIPLFARFVLPVADNITVGGGLSYQNYSESGFSGFSIIGIHARGNYHFNEIFELDSDQWDIYGGASLGAYIFNYPNDYIFGSGVTDLGFGIHAGARYFFNENLGANLEIGSGTVFTSSTIGLTIVL